MINEIIKEKYGKELKSASNEEIYFALLEKTKELSAGKENTVKKKKLYYISAEFLIGKLLSNNLINLGIYDEVREELSAAGKKLSEIEEVEPEPSLGNGGLGRLAACYLDSAATLALPADGVGLLYHCGLFRQQFKNNMQDEVPDKWIEEKNWLVDTGKSYSVDMGGIKVKSKMYDIAVVGYEGPVNHIHLFDAETADESIIGEGIDFDKDEVAKNLTLFLYPDDSDEKGRLLRVYQQYFMVSNAAQLILEECTERGSDLHDLADFAAIQINDTHPSMVIPELIRLLCEKGIDFEEAAETVTKVCAYTNHTILAEALEKWPISFLKKAAPAIVPIIEKLDAAVREKYGDESVYIIDENELVHMASMDIHYGHSVNGVASLHTDILKETELNNFYKIYPEKFNNKTNGITFRRWLLKCDPELSELISSLIGDGYKKDATELQKLLEFKDNEEVLTKLLAIKDEKKKQLKSWLYGNQGVEINTNSVFDVQIKRLHEYKRQQLNCLYIIHKYLEIRSGKLPGRPITVIFGAKAAPAYIIAKDIIHLILCLQQLIRSDRRVNKWLDVVMVENYNVSAAEKLIPACDISEQISLASKEASGTGNMKFMLNGAVTLGTMDGANVEIHDLVGEDNIYIFGEDSDTVIKRYADGSYCSKDYYKNDAHIHKLINFIISRPMLALGDRSTLMQLRNELINKDWFMTFPDFYDYVATRDKALHDYVDRQAWAKKMLVNIAKAGFFSSDRCIEEYNRDIWSLG